MARACRSERQQSIQTGPERRNTTTHWRDANVVWYAVKRCAGQAGINNLAPHDLCRTCARLCHSSGGELERIQFLLGHASVQTTERYIGSKLKLQDVVNDRIGISVAGENAWMFLSTEYRGGWLLPHASSSQSPAYIAFPTYCAYRTGE